MFDKTFFKFAIGLALILCASVIVMYVADQFDGISPANQVGAAR